MCYVKKYSVVYSFKEVVVLFLLYLNNCILIIYTHRK